MPPVPASRLVQMLILSAILVVGARPASARDYRNSVFGLSAPLPDGLHLCPQDPGDEDHGMDILMNSRAREGCDDLETHRNLDLFVGVESLERTLDQVFADECVEGPHGRCLPPYAGLRIRGWPSRSGWTFQPGGWVNIRIVARAPKGDGQWINYIFTLHTTRKALKADLAALRATLSRATIRPPPQAQSAP